MEKNIKKIIMKKTLAFFLIIFIGCGNAQESSFMNKIDNEGFRDLIHKYAKIESFPFAYKRIPVNELSPTQLEIDECVKFLKKDLNSLYYREEFYNYDEDTKEFGEKRLKPVLALLKYFIDNQNMILISNEFSGMNVSDSILTKLYVIDIKGSIKDEIIIKKEEYENDWLPDNYFVIIDEKNFNTYTYNVIERKDENDKISEFVYVTVEEFEISKNAKINLRNVTHNMPLKYKRYDQANPDNWPKDDPMRIFIDH